MPQPKKPDSYPDELHKLARLLAATNRKLIELPSPVPASHRQNWYGFLRACERSDDFTYELLASAARKFKCEADAENGLLRFIHRAEKMDGIAATIDELAKSEGISTDSYQAKLPTETAPEGFEDGLPGTLGEDLKKLFPDK